MPSPFSRGVQNADDMFDASAIDAANIAAMAALAVAFDNLTIAVAASGTGAAAITGLGYTPDWVLFGVSATPNALSWTATSTTLTLTGRSTTTAETITYICGLLT
jgi:hypothetical protein